MWVTAPGRGALQVTNPPWRLVLPPLSTRHGAQSHALSPAASHSPGMLSWPGVHKPQITTEVRNPRGLRLWGCLPLLMLPAGREQSRNVLSSIQSGSEGLGLPSLPIPAASSQDPASTASLLIGHRVALSWEGGVDSSGQAWTAVGRRGQADRC